MALRDNTETGLPWQRPELAGWSIVGMNHFHLGARGKDQPVCRDDPRWDVHSGRGRR